MNKFKLKIIFIISISIILISSITAIIYAAIASTSTRGDIEVSTATINASTVYTSSTNAFDNWVYTKAGDIKTVQITTENSASNSCILHRRYTIGLKDANSNSNLLKAILVYYNDEYVGQLYDIIDKETEIQSQYNFIGINNSSTDSFKFELHQGADNSIFDNKEIGITITTYTENADYYDNIFVSTVDEFKKALDDVNSNLFSTIPSIVLCNTLTLSNNIVYEILNPVKIALNGCTLNGNITLNDTDALIEILGNGTFNVVVTKTKYDADGALDLVKDYIKDQLGYGVAAGSTTNILGNYAFYGHTITANSNCTFTSPNVIVANSSNEYYNKIASIKLENDVISFKILGTKTALLDATLAYMPSDGATITSDLFLPTYIPSQSANITWTSSNEAIITNSGMITADRLENADVTLYAEIKVNETIITRSYSFKVSAHNNEINFYKLVQEISPLVINSVWNSSADDAEALYYLPIVSQNNDGSFNTYDYRTSYKTPTESEMFDWKAFKDIGLKSITYSMTQEQANAYDYITQSNNTVCLNTITLNNYAQITVTGDFGNNERYSTNINISISVGSNTQLLEKAFTQVSEELAEISVLANIITTRIDDGVANEKGDFSLSYHYLDKTTNTISDEYTIKYSGTSNIIPRIVYNETTEKYDFSINPEYFNEYETTVAFTATVFYRERQSGETSKSRTFYVVVPAALHVEDFGTISIYNSTKYQVIDQLPSKEIEKETGYTTSGSSLTDSNLDYILIRDIVGDDKYVEEYNANEIYLTKTAEKRNNIKAPGTTVLNYQVADQNPTSTTDTQAYDFARLIEWATGNTRAIASSVVTNTSLLGTLGNTKANAEDYLNNDEIAVLKQYYKSSTGATDSEWDSLYNEVFNVAPGYIFTKSDILNQVIACMGNESITYSSENYANLFGKYMEVLQRYALSTTTVNSNKRYIAPCQAQYNYYYVWYHSDTQVSAFTINKYNGVESNTNLDDSAYSETPVTFTAKYVIQAADGTYWHRADSGVTGNGGDGNWNAYYAIKDYYSDKTSYITENELQVLKSFWLTCVSSKNNRDTEGPTGYINLTFKSSNQTLISNVLNKYPDYYYKYSIDDFKVLGNALINAFDASLVRPTYFNADGVAKIIKAFYDKKAYDLPTYDGTTNTTTFKSSLNGNVPYITNADNIKSVLSYFINLKTLTFNGNSNLAIFLSENGLATVFARTGLYNTEIETLTMKHVAHSSVNFDLSNIKNFAKLKELNLSNNSGIQSVNELVNVNRGNYTSVNIEHIGVEYDYQEFAIDNIASSTCTVRYTNALGTNTYTNASNASLLAELSDFNKFITQYMYMTNVVYDENGTGTSVTWRIDDGNEINSTRITASGSYPEFNTIEEMNKFISPYYYCNEDFTYYYNDGSRNFTKNHLYSINCTSGTISFIDKGLYAIESELTDELKSDEIIDTSNYTPTTTVETSQTEEIGATSVYQTVSWYSEGSTTNNVTITLRGYYLYSTSGIIFTTTYYVCSDGSQLTSSDSTTNRKAFIFLTEAEILSFQNKEYDTNKTIGATFNNASGNYYMCYLNDGNLMFVGTTNAPSSWSNISVTSNFDSTYIFALNSKTIKIGSYYIYQSRGNIAYYTSSTTFEYANNNVTSNYSKTFSPYFEINYSDETKQKIEAYEVGYDITKLENVIITITEIESTVIDNKHGSYTYYYYTGNDTSYKGITIKKNTIIAVANSIIYPVTSRTRSMTIEGTFYTINVWYKTTNTADKQYISMDNVLSITTYQKNSTNTYSIATLSKPNNVTTISDYSDSWTTPLTSEWIDDGIVIYPYISYLSELSNNISTIDSLDKKLTIYDNVYKNYDYYYKYTGSTGSELVYKESINGINTSYTQNSGYKLSITNNVLTWNQYDGTLTNDTGTTMDSLLKTANSHFTDYRYGEYYGKYYGYNGTARYISSGIYVRPGYIYRIMPNATNTAFEWVEISSYKTDTSGNILKDMGTGVANVGDIFYSTAAAFGYFNSGWYKIVLDEKTNIVNLVKFNDLGLLPNNVQTYTRLTNDKMHKISAGDYLGYSGTFTVQISALIREINNGVVTKEYIKTYKLKFIGSLI